MPNATDSIFGLDNRALRVVWTVFLFGLLLAVVYFIRGTLLLFAGSIFFAYMLSPVVSVVERFFGKRRNLALAIVYVLLIGLLIGIGINLVPTIADEATSLAKRLPALVTGGSWAKIPLPAFLEPVREKIIDLLSKEAVQLQTSVVPFLQQAGPRILSGLGAVVPAILVPILAFFFLKDARSISAAVLNTIDGGRDRTLVVRILNDVHVLLRNYIRALVLLAIASFVAWVLFLGMMGYSYEFLLAGVAAVCEFVPVIGPAVAGVVVLIVCGTTGSGGLLWIVVFWACFRIFQDYVLNPYLMSSGVELHPLLVLFAVLAGEAIGGIPGMIFSVPVFAILRVVLHRLREARDRKIPLEAPQPQQEAVV
ncbi:MAG TPA: AI-2E family transporter [Bryobacteraceae bacterium]|nr:AI-2E family transporter [Bryobacteraceae bacterium]